MSLARHAMTVDGVQRRFLVAEPSRPATAVILSLHGTRSSAEGHVRFSQMAGLSDSAGAVVVFPEGVTPVGSGFEWDLTADMPYLVALVDELRSRYPTPTRRVCMTGMSGGARMSCHFAWRRADAVQMIGAVAGLRAGDAPPPSRPVPILAFHGTGDRINPYDGSGRPRPGESVLQAALRWGESVPEAARRWAVANGIADPPAEVAVSSTLARTTYGGDGQPGEVTLWTSKNAGHTWPGAQPGVVLRLFLGRTSSEINATAKIGSFAGSHQSEP